MPSYVCREATPTTRNFRGIFPEEQQQEKEQRKSSGMQERVKNQNLHISAEVHATTVNRRRTWSANSKYSSIVVEWDVLRKKDILLRRMGWDGMEVLYVLYARRTGNKGQHLSSPPPFATATNSSHGACVKCCCVLEEAIIESRQSRQKQSDAPSKWRAGRNKTLLRPSSSPTRQKILLQSFARRSIHETTGRELLLL